MKHLDFTLLQIEGTLKKKETIIVYEVFLKRLNY